MSYKGSASDSEAVPPICVTGQAAEKPPIIRWIWLIRTKITVIHEGLLHFLFAMGGEDMDIEITPDDVMKTDKKWRQAVLSGITLKERLTGVELKDILAEFSAEEIEACLKKLRKKQRK